MVRLTFRDAFQVCKTFEVLRDLIEDVPLYITPEGLSIVALDPGHVAVVVAHWPRKHFDTFDDISDDITVGLKISNFIKILRFAEKNDKLHIEITEDQNDVMAIMIEGESRNATFSMKLLDVSADSIGLPEMDIHACVTMDSAEFQLLVRDLGTLSDTVTISTHDDGISFEVDGDIGTAAIKLRDVGIDFTEHVSLGFALRYLASFSKASAICDRVALKLMNDMPICVEFAGTSCSLKYYLAPKLDTAMDD